MSFFQTMLIFFCLALGIGWLAQRVNPDQSAVLKNWIYYLLGFVFVIFISWTLLQFILGLPSLTEVIALEAALLGIIFALGIKSGFTVLQERSKLKKKNSGSGRLD